MSSPIIAPIEHERRMAICWKMDRIWMNPEDPEFIEANRIANEFFAPTIAVKELLKCYASGQRDFVDISLLHEADFTGVNLAGANLTGAKFNSSNFTEANLERANLSYAWLAGVNFMGANLQEANISWANAVGAIFINANLLNAIGWFNLNCYAVYENTVMPHGGIIKNRDYGRS